MAIGWRSPCANVSLTCRDTGKGEHDRLLRVDPSHAYTLSRPEHKPGQSPAVLLLHADLSTWTSTPDPPAVSAGGAGIWGCPGRGSDEHLCVVFCGAGVGLIGIEGQTSGCPLTWRAVAGR